MSRISKLTLAIFMLFLSNSYSQDRVIDSIKIILRNPKLHDTIKLSALDNAIWSYSQTDPKYKHLVNLMGAIAAKSLKKENDPKSEELYKVYLGNYYADSGNWYTVKNDIGNALAYLDKSISIYRSIKDYRSANMSMISKASAYSRVYDYEKAISIYYKALAYFEKDKTKDNSYYILSIYGNISTIYSAQHLYEKAIGFVNKQIDYYKGKSDFTPSEKQTLYVANTNKGFYFSQLEKYDEALKCYANAFLLAREIGNSNYTSGILIKTAYIKIKQSKTDEAKILLTEALTDDITESTKADIYLNLGRLYHSKNDLDKADHYLTEGFMLAKKSNDLNLQEMISKGLIVVSKANGNFEKALQMREFYDVLIDSGKIESTKNALAQQQLKYDFQKKEFNYTLASQKKSAVKNNWLIGLSGVLLLVLLGLYFYYRNNKQKQAITILEKDQIKQKLLVTQMNPHFIFNSIDNIQGLIHDKKDKEAVNYLTKFSVLTRQILENSNENYISLTEEVQMIENYLAIQQLLYNNKFDFSISVDEAIDGETIFLPPMLTQPFIENSIKHGLSNKSENGKVDIHFNLKEEKLLFEVSDNGKGFDDIKKTTNHKSLAMTITKERLIGYSKNLDFVVQTDNIKDTNENVVGAKVSFEIPYIYEN